MRRPGNKEMYMAEAFPVEDQVLRQVREALGSDGKDGIQVGESDARLLQFLLQGFGCRTVVEIGTLYGYSTLAMARALPADGKIFSIDVSEDNHAKAKELLRGAKDFARIEFLTGDGQVHLEKLTAKGPFDAVFIDANKGSYLQYLDWAEQNVRRGGLIIGDNTFLFDALFGVSRDPKIGEKQIAVMREFNQRLANRERYNSVIIPTGEGMTVAQKL